MPTINFKKFLSSRGSGNTGGAKMTMVSSWCSNVSMPKHYKMSSCVSFYFRMDLAESPHKDRIYSLIPIFEEWVILREV